MAASISHTLSQFDEALKLYLRPWEWPTTCIPPICLFICGYRRTGKDTLAKSIQNVTSHEKHDYDVFINNPMYIPHALPLPEEDIKGYLSHFEGAPVVSFAEAIKDITRSVLHLSQDFDFETQKDLPCHQASAYGFNTLRDVLIYIGMQGRKMDPEYWVKRALLPHFVYSGYDAKYVICSDFRFKNEYTIFSSLGPQIFAKPLVITLRVFRRSVPIPAAEIESEHNLDNFKTDITMVAAEDNMNRFQLQSIFPIAAANTRQIKRVQL
jgi:hypothetical protein